MARKRLEMSEKELKEHKKQLHTKNARKRREKERLWAYRRFVEAILDQLGIESAKTDEIALKMAKNGEFRLICSLKPPKLKEKE